MLGITRGTRVPARNRLFAFVVAAIAAAPIAASADDGLVDVRALPRLERAVENTARTEPHSLGYGVPTPVTVTTPAIEKLLAADGWVQCRWPLEESGTSLLFKKGRQGLFVSFTQGLKRPDQSSVSYDANRIPANVTFPGDAINVMFDERRPYLGCVSAASVDASLDFFRRELVASGWSPLSDVDIVRRWPRPRSARRPRTACAPIIVRTRMMAAISSRLLCCRYSAVATAAPPSKSRLRRSRCRRISRSPGRRSTCPNRITRQASEAPVAATRSAAKSRASQLLKFPWCSRSIAANSRLGPGRKRPAAPSSPTMKSHLIFPPRSKPPRSSSATNTT